MRAGLTLLRMSLPLLLGSLQHLHRLPVPPPLVRALPLLPSLPVLLIPSSLRAPPLRVQQQGPPQGHPDPALRGPRSGRPEQDRSCPRARRPKSRKRLSRPATPAWPTWRSSIASRARTCTPPGHMSGTYTIDTSILYCSISSSCIGTIVY